MWMSREEAAKYFFENKYGKGTECQIEENEVTYYGNDECFDLDEFYQIGVKEDGTILHFYYNIDGSIDIDEQDIDWDHPIRIEDVTDEYEDNIDYIIEKNGEGLRTLEDVVKGMKNCKDKEALETLIHYGGYIYEMDDDIVFSDGTLSMYWNSDKSIREEYNNNFGDYARAAAVKCLKIAGMTDEEIENELKSWDFPSEVPEHE